MSFISCKLTFVIFTPDSPQRWRSLSDVPPHCDYKIKAAQDPGVIFSSPLPACQSETKVRPCCLLSPDSSCKSLCCAESETLLIQISSAVFVLGRFQTGAEQLTSVMKV